MEQIGGPLKRKIKGKEREEKQREKEKKDGNRKM
jgi:hypothetical protein